MVDGALALAPALVPFDDPTTLASCSTRPRARTAGARDAPATAPASSPRTAPPATDADGRVVSTGFAALDAILGTGGLPRTTTVALRGDASSGQTTLALRLAAEAQAVGRDRRLARPGPGLRPGRGRRPRRPAGVARRAHPVDLEEALALAAALLAARTVDLLVVDLPDGRTRRSAACAWPTGWAGWRRSRGAPGRCS